MRPNWCSQDVARKDKKSAFCWWQTIIKMMHLHEMFASWLAAPTKSRRGMDMKIKKRKRKKREEREEAGSARAPSHLGASRCACGHKCSGLIVLLLLFTSATILTTTTRTTAQQTTSLPASAQSGAAHQAIRDSQQQQAIGAGSFNSLVAPEVEGSPAPPAPDLLAVRALPLSARGALAFARHAPELEATGAEGPRHAHALVSTNNQLITSATPASHLKCPQASPAPSARAARQQPAAASAQVVAVEGASLKLNLVITGHRLQPVAGQEPAGPGWRLRSHWTRDGEPIGELNQARGRMSSVQLANENEPEAVRHLFGLAAPLGLRAHFRNVSSGSAASNSVSNRQQAPGADEQPLGEQAFMLAPYANERQLARLEAGHLSPGARQSVAMALKWARRAPNLADDFLADGQSIDWHKLGAYLRFNDEQESQSPICARLATSAHNIEQLLVIQLEINQVTLADRGQYELNICQQRVLSAADNCASGQQQVATIALQLAEDVPRFESWFEPQLLEPGDRLSIKCEATGFTLPQISWFLDGQQLSEHQLVSSSHQHGHRSAQLSSGHLLALGGQFRIGDYVSQDNHVHSFVNSSSIRVGDGGFYKCQANNGFHLIEHEARIDVRGPVNIERRLISNASALVGTSRLEIQCPFSGYPVGSVEWYFKPLESSGASFSSLASFGGQQQDYRDLVATNSRLSSMRAARLKRRPPASQTGPIQRDDPIKQQLHRIPAVSSVTLNEPTEPDPDKDEWLSQAAAMTAAPTSEDYPEPLPDYPVPASGYESPADADGSAPLVGTDLDRMSSSAYYEDLDSIEARESAPSAPLDYGDIQMDFQQQQTSLAGTRRKRSARQPSDWTKLPQSRRHQVHLNGTLMIHEISRQDHGLYRCRVSSPASSPMQTDEQQSGVGVGVGEPSAASSNELQLNVLVPPVISPFASSDSLREGMRNFLTCSVIEGDSPVKLHWLKDERPIEEHIEQTIARASDSSNGHSQSSQQLAGRPAEGQHISWAEQPSAALEQQQLQQPMRIRVETSNEYTSTLYFSHVDFRDSGNYTCMATNKAASVNYTAKMLVNVPPKWIKSPGDVECVSGQNIVIDCQAEAHPNPRIWWEVGVVHSADKQEHDKNQQQTIGKSPSGGGRLSQVSQTIDNNGASVSPAGSQSIASTPAGQPPNHYRTIISNSRIHILENASLVIRDVNKQDQGYYLCQAANNFGLLSALIKLTVNVGASFSNKYLMKYVKLNERIEFDCDPSGQSPVTVTWFMRQQQQSSISLVGGGQNTGQSQLNQNTSATHLINNRHQQRTTNQSSIGQSRQIVQQPNDGLGRRLFTGTIRTELPIIAGSSSPPAAASYKQQEATFKLLDEPFQDTSQQQKAVEIDSTMSFEILKRPSGLSELVRLYIKQAKRSHSGEFICQATNQFGGDEKLIKLLVQEAPDPVQEISAVQVDSRSVSLAWSVPFNGNSPITSYVVEWAPFGGDTSSSSQPTAGSPATNKWSHLVAQQPTITIGSLQPMTSYEFRVRAHNQIGHSPLSAPNASPFIITTIEEAPATPPSDIKALPLSSSSLQITWLPPVSNVINVNQNEQFTHVDPPNGVDTLGINVAARYSIKGYYLGYKVANSTDSFVFKTVSLFNQGPTSSGLDSSNLFALPDFANFTLNNNITQKYEAARRLRVVIGDLKRSTKYAIIVQAFNSAGPGPQSDPIEARTLLNDPPPTPTLRVGLVTYTSIELQWSFQMDSFNSLPSSNGLDSDEDETLNDHLIGLSGQPMSRFSPSSALALALASSSSSQTGDSSNQPDANDAKELATIEGYHLYYRALEGEWHEKKLSQETHTIITSGSHMRNDLTIVEMIQPANSGDKALTSVDRQQKSQLLSSAWNRHSVNSSLASKSYRFILDQLACGNSYQIYLIAYNSFGSGLPSQILRAKTRGSPPIAPHKHEFIQVNSTFVQLNLDSWGDGGCSLSNFEIRYKQLSSRSEASTLANNQQQANRQNGWLLLSSNISPEQRSIELRDLKTETWYAILATAESAAGKTDTQYAFMTLDKFGQLPAEATLDQPNNLPALFRGGNASIRSILYNFSGQSGMVSPLLISACTCLILFATCSLFLIRRYNSLMKDSASIDSRTTTGALSSVIPFSHHHHHHRQDSSSSLPPIDHKLNSMAPIGNESPHEHYSMKVSPCKTGTTIITNSTSSTNGSSALLINGGSSSLCDSTTVAYAIGQPARADGVENQQGPQVDLSQFIAATGATSYGLTSHSRLMQQHNNQQRDDQFCPLPNYAAETSTGLPKFATLTRDGCNPVDSSAHLQQQIQSTANHHFKTMPHSSLRPISTFLSPSATDQQHCQITNDGRFVCDSQQHQQQNDCQQQIYSKLRLLQHYNATSNYNFGICRQQQQEGGQKTAQDDPMGIDHQVYNGNSDAFVPLSAAHVQCNNNNLNNQQHQNNNTCQSQQQQSNQTGSEQDDYALPFPPKWV